MASIRERKDRDKRWEVRWRVDDRQQSKSFRLKSEARAFAARVELEEFGSFERGAKARQPLVNFGREWLPQQTHLKASSVVAYEKHLRTIEKYLGDLSLVEVRPTKAQHLVTTMLEDGYSHATIRVTLTVLRMCLNAAVAEDILDKTGLEGWRLRLPQEDAQDVHMYLTPEQVRELADVAEAMHGRGLDVEFLAMTGLRLGEFLTLRKMDVTDECDAVVVRREVAKSSRRREVPIAPHLRERLCKVLSDLGDEDLVFGAPESTYRNWWNAWRDEVGLEGLRIHDMRHTCASLLKHSGADIQDIQKWLGHASMDITADIYTHLFPERLEGLAGGLSGLLGR